MAAKTAAEDGLNVLLIEHKRYITRINRACGGMFMLEWVCPDGYIETVKIEISQDKTRFIFPGPGFSIDYTGPLKPYTNAIWISPSGYKLYFYKNEIFAFCQDKELLLAGLLSEVKKAGAEVLTGTAVIGVENTTDGVKVFVRGKSGEQILEARKAIIAEGLNSKTVESLGLNEKRKVWIGPVESTSCLLEGMEPTIPGHETGYITFKIPSTSDSEVGGSFGMGLAPGDAMFVGANYKEFAKNPEYTPWFRNARVVKKMAATATVRTPLREPVAGNVLVLADAAAPIATFITGAEACGYQAAKTTLKELNGQKGWLEYTAWWQKAFYFNDPSYFKRLATHYGLLQLWTDDEVDYISKFFQDTKTFPTLALGQNPALIKDDNPALYDKTMKGLDRLLKWVEPLVATYPPGSAIFKEPDAYLGPWRPYVVSL